MFCTIASTIKTQKEEVAEEVQFKGPFAYETVQLSANLSFDWHHMECIVSRARKRSSETELYDERNHFLAGGLLRYRAFGRGKTSCYSVVNGDRNRDLERNIDLGRIENRPLSRMDNNSCRTFNGALFHCPVANS